MPESDVLVSILIPTIPGRERELQEVTEAFTDQGYGQDILTTCGVYTWGEGINQLAKRAKGRYWLFACDDTVPERGWFASAQPMVDLGLCPASRYFHPGGEPLHPWDEQPGGSKLDWTRSFLVTPERYSELGPMIDATWYSDFYYSERHNAHGYQVTACDGFNFTHLHTERDWLNDEVDRREREVYANAVSMIEAAS